MPRRLVELPTAGRVWYDYQMNAALDVRKRILDTAYDLLAEHGVAHLTQPRVSRAAGVRQSHLTYYFPRRSDLLLALARHSMEQLAGPFVEPAHRGSLGAERIADVFLLALSDRRRVRAVLGLIAAADEDAAVREALRDLVQRVRGRLGELFAALGLPSDPDTVALLHAFIVGAGVLHHARADELARAEAQKAMRFAVQTLMRRRTSSARPRRKKTNSTPKDRP